MGHPIPDAAMDTMQQWRSLPNFLLAVYPDLLRVACIKPVKISSGMAQHGITPSEMTRFQVVFLHHWFHLSNRGIVATP